MTEAGHHTIYLDRNENNYGPAPACFEVLRTAGLSTLSWYDRSYAAGIKNVLSARIGRDLGLPEERVVLGYGAEQILKQTVQCYLSKNAKLMVPAYSWWYYKRIASEVEGVSIEYPMTMESDRFSYDPAAMRDVYARERPAMVFISSPNNPTGNAISLPELEEVLRDFRESVVVLDEAYVFHGRSSYVRELVDTYPNLLVVRTMSKYYALAGARVGFALLGKNLSALARFSNRYLGFHRLSEELALAALDSPDYYAGIARKMQEDKELYYTELGKLPGYRVFRSESNFILVAIPPACREGLQAYLAGKGLIVKFMNEPPLDTHIRITIGTREENRMLIHALRAYEY